jgi:hypothetical protein
MKRETRIDNLHLGFTKQTQKIYQAHLYISDRSSPPSIHNRAPPSLLASGHSGTGVQPQSASATFLLGRGQLVASLG